MIANVQVRNVQKSRSGLTRMAKLTFEDLSGSTPAMLWPEEFAKLGELVRNDLIGFVKGTLDRRREPAELIISKIMPIETAASELARGVIVRLHKGVHRDEDLERLLRFIRVHPGHLDLYLEIVGIEQVRRAIYRAGPSLRIRYDDQLQDRPGAGGRFRQRAAARSARGHRPTGPNTAGRPAFPDDGAGRRRGRTRGLGV